MKEYKLKPGQESFRVVDGPFRGCLYLPDVTYHTLPDGEFEKFEEVKPAKKAKVEKKDGDQQ